MLRTWALMLGCLLGMDAWAAQVSWGVGVGAGMDLPDSASGSHTRFGPGPVLTIPVRAELSPRVHFRATALLETGIGTDRYTWRVGVAGEDVRLATDGHFAMVGLGGATVGTDIVLIDRPTSFYAGVGLGAAWVGTFHSFGEDTAQLMDPNVNDLDNPRNIDPYSSQGVWLTEIRAGVQWGDAMRGFVECSLGGAWVGEAELRKTLSDYEVRRSAYGWTPVRLVGGIWF